jgi:hypothetical protein
MRLTKNTENWVLHDIVRHCMPKCRADYSVKIEFTKCTCAYSDQTNYHSPSLFQWVLMDGELRRRTWLTYLEGSGKVSSGQWVSCFQRQTTLRNKRKFQWPKNSSKGGANARIGAFVNLSTVKAISLAVDTTIYCFSPIRGFFLKINWTKFSGLK